MLHSKITRSQIMKTWSLQSLNPFKILFAILHQIYKYVYILSLVLFFFLLFLYSCYLREEFILFIFSYKLCALAWLIECVYIGSIEEKRRIVSKRRIDWLRSAAGHRAPHTHSQFLYASIDELPMAVALPNACT